MGPGSPAVAASQTGSCTPLHNVLDPRVCAYFRPSARVIGLKHDAERGNLVPPCMSLSEHHEHLDPLAPLLADCLEKWPAPFEP